MTQFHIQYRTISFGSKNEDDDSNVWEALNEGNDPSEIILQDNMNAGTEITNLSAPEIFKFKKQDFQFVFWSAAVGDRGLQNYPKFADNLTVLEADVENMPGEGHATAWYVPSGGHTDGIPGGPSQALRVRTFDTDLNTFRKETPISGVTPKKAWAGPNNHSASTKDADIAATLKSKLDFPVLAKEPKQPAKLFRQWQTIAGKASGSKKQAKIECAKGQAAVAIAFYGADPDKKPPTFKPSDKLQGDFWGEFFGRLGAEGSGPFGPHGPHGPQEMQTVNEFARSFENVIGSLPRQQQLIVRKVLIKAAKGG